MGNLLLVDGRRVTYGALTIERQDGDVVLGRLSPSPDYARIREIFENYERIINDQVFSLLDEIESRVEQLGLMVVSAEGGEPQRVLDLQIMSDGAFSFRLQRRA